MVDPLPPPQIFQPIRTPEEEALERARQEFGIVEPVRLPRPPPPSPAGEEPLTQEQLRQIDIEAGVPSEPTPISVQPTRRPSGRRRITLPPPPTTVSPDVEVPPPPSPTFQPPPISEEQIRAGEVQKGKPVVLRPSLEGLPTTKITVVEERILQPDIIEVTAALGPKGRPVVIEPKPLTLESVVSEFEEPTALSAIGRVGEKFTRRGEELTLEFELETGKGLSTEIKDIPSEIGRVTAVPAGAVVGAGFKFVGSAFEELAEKPIETGLTFGAGALLGGVGGVAGRLISRSPIVLSVAEAGAGVAAVGLGALEGIKIVEEVQADGDLATVLGKEAVPIAAFGAGFIKGPKIFEQFTVLTPKFRPTTIVAGKETFEVPTTKGVLDIEVIPKGTIPPEPLPAQVALAGEEVTAVTAARSLFKPLKKEVIIDKPLPTPKVSELETGLFFDPKGRLRVSRLGLEEGGDLSSEISFSFIKLEPQAVIIPKLKVEEFPLELRGVKAKLEAGKPLTQAEQLALEKFQLKPTGKAKPVGFVGEEAEVTLPKGEIIAKTKELGTTLIKGRRVRIIEAEVKTVTPETQALLTKQQTTGLTLAEESQLRVNLLLESKGISRPEITGRVVSPIVTGGSLSPDIKPSRAVEPSVSSLAPSTPPSVEPLIPPSPEPSPVIKPTSRISPRPSRRPSPTPSSLPISPISRPISQPISEPISQLISSPRVDPFSRVPPPPFSRVPPPPFREVPPPPTIVEPVPSFIPFEKLRGPRLLDVIVGRKGKEVFFEQKDLPFREAIRFGKRGVTETAAATVRFRDPITEKFLPAEEFEEFFGKEFRRGKRSPFDIIQRREARIGTRGELEDITFKGLKQRRSRKFSTLL